MRPDFARYHDLAHFANRRAIPCGGDPAAFGLRAMIYLKPRPVEKAQGARGWRARKWRKGMKMTLKTMTLAAATFACAALFSPGWSEQGGVSLSVSKAEAYVRLRVHPAYSAVYVPSAGLAWYAVRAYYFGGPWSGPGYSYAGWDDYAARNGIGCRPGTVVPGGDGIMYLCQ